VSIWSVKVTSDRTICGVNVDRLTIDGYFRGVNILRII